MRTNIAAYLFALSTLITTTFASAGDIEIDASNIAIATRYRIGGSTPFSVKGSTENVFIGYPRYSPDGSLLLYSRITSDGESDIVIINVATKKTEKIFNGPDNAVWSPDGRKIAYAQQGGFGIYEIASGKHTSVVSPFGRTDYQFIPVWDKDERILFLKLDFGLTKEPSAVNSYAVSGGSALDLNALSIKEISQEEALQAAIKFIPRKLGATFFFSGNIGLPDGSSIPIPSLQTSNADGSFTKVLVEGLRPDSARYDVSPKLNSVVYETQDGLYLASLATYIKTAKKYTTGDFQSHLTDEQKKIYSSLISRNIRILGGVYAPQINPLTGKVAGPDYYQFKGTVQIIGTDHGKLTLKKILERKSFVTGDNGDVVSGFVSDPDNLAQGKKIQFDIWSTFSVLE
jgi:dipeptidyl aminopeptidase/acylaminoacyl peptidase